MIVTESGEKIPTVYDYKMDPCPHCSYKKGVANKAYRGVKIPGFAQGKCTRPQGLCSLKGRADVAISQ